MPNIILITTIAIVSALIGFFISTWITKRKLRLLESISEQIKKAENKKKDLDSSLFSHYKIVETKKAEADLAIKRHREEMQRAISDTDEIKSSIQKYRDMIDNQKSILSVLRDETAHLKKMKDESVSIQEEYDKLDEKRAELIDLQVQRDILVDQISLYTDMDTYIDSGLYPLPSYGEFSAGGYSEILKDNRAAQKEMLKKGDAYTYPHNIVITGNPDYDNRCAMSQGQLLVRAFNSECDYLISKISTKNYEATMTRIEQLAEKLEKMLVTLEVGLSLPYVELKMQECSIFYQYQCRKALEAEEQREIRAQMREEAAAQREIEKALRDAEREEMIIQQTMQKVRQEMAAAGEMQRLQYEAQLSALQHKLIEAEAKGQRALSMAQQTRRGHVYIIGAVLDN